MKFAYPFSKDNPNKPNQQKVEGLSRYHSVPRIDMLN